MQLHIADTTYRLKTAARTLFTYRAIWGESFQSAAKSDEEWALKLLRLLYVGINGERPEWDEFLAAAVKEKRILSFAAAYQSAVMGKPKKHAKQEADGGDDDHYDEYRLLALLVMLEVPEWIIDELPLFDVLRMVEELTEIKSGKTKKTRHMMTREEILAFYGVPAGGKQNGEV